MASLFWATLYISEVTMLKNIGAANNVVNQKLQNFGYNPRCKRGTIISDCQILRFEQIN